MHYRNELYYRFFHISLHFSFSDKFQIFFQFFWVFFTFYFTLQSAWITPSIIWQIIRSYFTTGSLIIRLFCSWIFRSEQSVCILILIETNCIDNGARSLHFLWGGVDLAGVQEVNQTSNLPRIFKTSSRSVLNIPSWTSPETILHKICKGWKILF